MSGYIIYLSLLIPFIGAALLFLFFKKKMMWWEYSLPMIVSFIFIISAKGCYEHNKTSDTEYWGDLVQTATYYEDWNEYIHQTCTRTVSCGKDCQTTETYDCSYVDYHPERWEITTTTGNEISISKELYQRLIKLFGNSQFKDMHRNYYTDDGDAYFSTWPQTEPTSYPITTEHTYENKVQVSSDVFNFVEVDKADKDFYGLFDYPETNGLKNYPILGFKDDKANKRLDYLNGYFGPRKQVRLWVLVFKGKVQNAALYQESYWKGGNKNEIVVNIGIDSLSNKVDWCKTFTWCEDQFLKLNIEEFISKQDTLDLCSLSNFLETEIPNNFKRRSFKEFEYLEIPVSTTFLVIVFIITLLITLGVCIWNVVNDFETYEIPYKYRSHYRY